MPPMPPSPTRLYYARVVLMLASVALVLLQIAWSRPLIGDVQDDGEYFVGAQSLRDGRGYVLPSRPLSPPATKYPPGVSALAAVFMAAVPGPPTLASDALAVRIFMGAVAVAFMWVSYAWLVAAGVDALGAAFAATFGVLNPTVLQQVCALMSDLPFALVTAFALWCWYACAERGGAKWSLIVGLMAGVAAIIRSQGISLLFGFAVGLLAVPRRGRLVALMIGALGVLIPVHLLLASRDSAPLPERYVDDFQYYVEKSPDVIAADVAERAATYMLVPGDVIAPLVTSRSIQRVPMLGKVILITLSAITAIGAVAVLRSCNRRHLPVSIHWAATIGILLIWPWNLGCRPLVWAIPLYFVLFARGFKWVTSFTRPRVDKALCFATIVIVAASSTLTTGYITYARGRSTVDSDTADAFLYLREQTPPDAVVVTFFPECVFLYTGREAVKLPLDADRVCGRVGKFDHLQQWAQLCPGRQIYLLGCSRESDANLAEHYERVEADPKLQARRLFTGSTGRVWIDAIIAPKP